MAKALSDLRTGTRIYLDESQPADYLASEVDIAINFAYHDVCGAVIEIKEDFYQTLTPFTYAMVANQQEYTIDSSLIKVNRVEINFTPANSSSIPLKATPAHMDEMLINLSNTSTAGFLGNVGYYLHGSIGSQKIGFIPIPNNSDTGSGKSISVWGIQLPGDLVNATDSVTIPYADRFSYLINLRAAGDLLSKGQQEESAGTKYLQLYDKGIEKMKNFLVDRQEDSGEFVQDISLENYDFGFPL